MLQVKVRTSTIKELQKAGIPIMSGMEYFKDWPKPKKRFSLRRLQKILSKIPGRMDEEIARMREEEAI